MEISSLSNCLPTQSSCRATIFKTLIIFSVRCYEIGIVYFVYIKFLVRGWTFNSVLFKPTLFSPTGNEVDLILMSTFTVCRYFLTICIPQEWPPLWKFVLENSLEGCGISLSEGKLLSGAETVLTELRVLLKNDTSCLLTERISVWQAPVDFLLCTGRFLNPAIPSSLDHSWEHPVQITIAYDSSAFCESAAGFI